MSPKPSPLKQGGLEIMITMTVKWKNSRTMEVLKNHIEKVSYSENGKYSDDSSKILKEFLDNPASESDESDVEIES